MEDLAHRAYLLLKAGLSLTAAKEELGEFGASPEEASTAVESAEKMIHEENEIPRWEDEGGYHLNDSPGG